MEHPRVGFARGPPKNEDNPSGFPISGGLIIGNILRNHLQHIQDIQDTCLNPLKTPENTTNISIYSIDCARCGDFQRIFPWIFRTIPGEKIRPSGLASSGGMISAVTSADSMVNSMINNNMVNNMVNNG